MGPTEARVNCSIMRFFD